MNHRCTQFARRHSQRPAPSPRGEAHWPQANFVTHNNALGPCYRRTRPSPRDGPATNRDSTAWRSHGPPLPRGVDDTGLRRALGELKSMAWFSSDKASSSGGCMAKFDVMVYCFSEPGVACLPRGSTCPRCPLPPAAPAYQLRKYYRDGDVDGCRDQVRAFVECNSASTKSRASSQRAPAPASAKVWTLRQGRRECEEAWEAEISDERIRASESLPR